MAKTIGQQIQNLIEDLYNREANRNPLNTSEITTRLKEIQKHSEDYRIALENLTPGGSEFYNDKDYCVDWIQKRLIERNNFLKDKIRLQRKLNEFTK